MYKNSYYLRQALFVAGITLSSFAGALAAAAPVLKHDEIVDAIRANDLTALEQLMERRGAKAVFASYKTSGRDLGIVAYARSIPRDLCAIAMLKRFGPALYATQEAWESLIFNAKTRGTKLQALLQSVQEEAEAQVAARKSRKRARVTISGDSGGAGEAPGRRVPRGVPLAPIVTDLADGGAAGGGGGGGSGSAEGPSSTMSAQAAVPNFVVDVGGAGEDDADVVGDGYAFGDGAGADDQVSVSWLDDKADDAASVASGASGRESVAEARRILRSVAPDWVLDCANWASPKK